MIATPKLEGAKFEALKEQVKNIKLILSKTEIAEAKSISDSTSSTVRWVEVSR